MKRLLLSIGVFSLAISSIGSSLLIGFFYFYGLLFRSSPKYQVEALGFASVLLLIIGTFLIFLAFQLVIVRKLNLVTLLPIWQTVTLAGLVAAIFATSITVLAATSSPDSVFTRALESWALYASILISLALICSGYHLRKEKLQSKHKD